MGEKINLDAKFVQNTTDFTLLNVPYVQQGEHSSNCGPCSVKMLIDYYDVRGERDEPYKLHALNRLLDTSKTYGCDEESIQRFLADRLALTPRFIQPTEIETALKLGQPILCAFVDELHDGHFALIIGLDLREASFPSLIFHDPWPDFGPYFRRNLLNFLCRLEDLDNWLLVLGD